MPQSTKREGFVLGPKGRLRSAAKQEPQTVGEMPCLYDNKKEQSMTAQILLAEREESLKWMALDMYSNVIPLFSATLFLIFTFYCLTFFNDVSRRGSRR